MSYSGWCNEIEMRTTIPIESKGVWAISTQLDEQTGRKMHCKHSMRQPMAALHW